MSYTREDVKIAFFGNGRMNKHQRDCVEMMKSILIEKGSFSMDELHEKLQENCNRPSTSNYGGLVSPVMDAGYLNKIDDRFYPTNFLKCFLGIYE